MFVTSYKASHLRLASLFGQNSLGVPGACLGVPVIEGHSRAAMAAVRHSRIEPTMNYYTDPVPLDMAGAVGTLPNFSADQSDSATRTAKGA